MAGTEIDALFDRVEYLQDRIEAMDFLITKHRVVSQAYDSRIPKVEDSKEKVDWVLKSRDYLNKLEKKAIEAQYWKSVFEKELEEKQQQLDEKLGGD